VLTNKYQDDLIVILVPVNVSNTKKNRSVSSLDRTTNDGGRTSSLSFKR